MDTEFAIRLAGPKTWSITNSSGHTFYVLDGMKKTAVIDTGCTPGRTILPLIRQLTSKPLLLILTHAHNDHIYHMDEFSEIYINHREFELSPDFLHSMMNGKDLKLKDAADLHTGSVIDLGDTVLEILEVPGHTPGSIAVYDPQSNQLFTGDAIGSGNDVWMHWPSALPLDQYLVSLRSLLVWAVNHGGQMSFLGGHERQCFTSHLLSYNPLSLGLLADLIDLVDGIVSGSIVGIRGDADILLVPETPLCASYGRATIQYVPSRIHSSK